MKKWGKEEVGESALVIGGNRRPCVCVRIVSSLHSYVINDVIDDVGGQSCLVKIS